MNTKKKYKKSTLKKYATGTQTVTGNVDPTTLYSTGRDKSVADTQFNNAQQAELNKGLTKQQYSDTANQAVNDFGVKQSTAVGNRSAAGSAISNIPVAGNLVAAGMSIGGGMGDKLNQKSFDQALAGENNKGTQQTSLLLTDTGSKLAAAKSGVDIAEAFIPINGLFGDSSQDKAEQKAVAAKNQQAYVDKQMSQYGTIDSTVQNAQLKKGTKKLKARIIETEGREPIFSPKDSSGERELLYHNSDAPTHEGGGVKAAVVKSGKDKIRGMLTIPEGSAIVSANNGMNQKALKAYRDGDKNKLNSIINKMPDDNKSKFDDGTDLLDIDGNILQGNKNTNSKALEDSIFGERPNVMFNDAVPNSIEQPAKGTKTLNTSKLSSTGNSILNAAPSLYNLGRGLFEKPKTTTRRYINNEGYKYKDLSDPSKRAANEQFRVESNNIKNATGGSGGAYLANQNLAAANRFKNMSDINNQEAGKRLDISNSNTNLKNQQNAQNLQLANQYDDLDTQNVARKNDFVGAGLTGLSDLAFNSQLMKNQANNDRIRASTLETNNYKYDMEKEQKLFKSYKKGNKSLKYKKK